MKLQQPPSLWEFPRIFVAFLDITCRASNDNMRNIITCILTSYGERMVSMVVASIFSQFGVAVVTPSMLAVVLLFNLSCSVIAWNSFFQSPTVTHVSIMLSKVINSISILGLASFVPVFEITALCLFVLADWIRCISHAIHLPKHIQIISSFRSNSQVNSILMLFVVIFLTFYTPLLQLICLLVCKIKVFSRSGKSPLTTWTPFLSSFVVHAAFFAKVCAISFALFAVRREFTLVSMKVGGCCWKHLKASRTMFFALSAIWLLNAECRSFASALLTKRVPSISIRGEFVKVLGGSREKLSAFSALLWIIYMFVSILYISPFSFLCSCLCTWSAIESQCIFRVAHKVIKSGREPLFTIRTLFQRSVLRYNIIHRKAPILAITPLDMSVSRRHQYFYSNYTIDWLMKPIYGIFYVLN